MPPILKNLNVSYFNDFAGIKRVMLAGHLPLLGHLASELLSNTSQISLNFEPGAVCKINIASDGWIAMTASVRKALAEHPATIDPRKYLKPARDEMKQVYIRKNREIFASAGKAYPPTTPVQNFF